MRILISVLLVTFLGAPLLASSGSETLAGQAVLILQKRCAGCHGANGRAQSGLDLRSRQGLLRGGERGEAIALGEPDYSLLYQSVTARREPRMPPAGDRLTASEVEVLRRWIEAGVPWPATPAERDMPLREARTAPAREHWSFQPPADPRVPSTGDRHPIDAFLRAGWRKAGVIAAPMAAPRDLVRRAYLDLAGLPPAPAEIDGFERDPSGESWRRLIDRLLASPGYGVRWARHWLDVARYADSGGFEFDNDRPNAARYRDWVVAAFNTDKPYDQFIREQLAGDELDPPSLEATGFLRLGPEHNLKNDLTRQFELDDLVSTTSLAFLGLTASCARCHDHKYDAISQGDYYRLQAAFASTRAHDEPLAPPGDIERHRAAEREAEERRQPLEAEKQRLEAPYRSQAILEKLARLPLYMRAAWETPAARRTTGQRLNARQIEAMELSGDALQARMSREDAARYAALRAALRALDASRPPPLPAVMAISEHGRDPLPSYLLRGGDPSAPIGPPVEPGGIEAIGLPFRAIAPPPGAHSSYRRRSLAEWIASPRHPLTARVMVNRIWQHHFGEGLVRTPSDFGTHGERPTHPELLDWLAARFVESGWSVKQMHRLIMTSRAYRLAANGPAPSQTLDPDNRLLWRRRPARLEAETIRDAMLAVAGTLDPALGGPAVFPFIEPALWQKSSLRLWPGLAEGEASTWRRSLYVFQKRTIRYPLFESFDQPDPAASCARRNATITAPQALLMMNGGFARFQAAEFARRIAADPSPVRAGFRLALGREPSAAEWRASMQLVREAGLASFCLALFNLNEFAFAP